MRVYASSPIDICQVVTKCGNSLHIPNIVPYKQEKKLTSVRTVGSLVALGGNISMDCEISYEDQERRSKSTCDTHFANGRVAIDV